MLELVSALIAVAAAVVATAQTYVARAATHGELVGSILDDFWRPESVRARAHVFTLQHKPLDEWTEADVVAAEGVLRQLSQIGFMVRNRYISHGAFLEFWGARALRSYIVVEPYVMRRRHDWQADDQWAYAEWLARTAALRRARTTGLANSRSMRRLRKRTGALRDPGIVDSLGTR